MNASLVGVCCIALGVTACSGVPGQEDATNAESDLTQAEDAGPRVARLRCSVLPTLRDGFSMAPLWAATAPYDVNGNARIAVSHPLKIGGEPIGVLEGTITSRLRGYRDGLPVLDFALNYEVTLSTNRVVRGGVAFENTTDIGSFVWEVGDAFVGSNDHQAPPTAPGKLQVYTPCTAVIE